jgi:hypothetical protein
MELPKNDLATFFSLASLLLKKNRAETESWIIPAFLALALSFVLTAKWSLPNVRYRFTLLATNFVKRDSGRSASFLMHILEQIAFELMRCSKAGNAHSSIQNASGCV